TVLDELESDEQAAATDVADLLVRRLELAQPPEQVLPLLAGALDEAFLFDSLEHRETGGGGQRVGDVRGDVEEALPDTVLLDKRVRDGRREWDAAAERLRDGHEIRDDAVVFEPEHRPQPSEPGLRLVKHEQHPAGIAELAQAAEVSVRGDDDPPGREHRLGNDRAERAD